MKTHQKVGITGALKNLVGINVSKSYLVHHRIGTPPIGDEFPSDVSRLFILQTRLREMFQKRSKIVFKVLKIGWELIKKVKRIETQYTREVSKSENKIIYIGPGSWYGNDSVWRMVYDLNLIIFKGNSLIGKIDESFQRDYVAILDGIVSGEGNGPLQVLPVYTNLIAVSFNPFLIDFAIAKIMGFDYKKIKLLSNYKLFRIPELVSFEPNSFVVYFNGRKYTNGVEDIPIFKPFIPPPGWKGHIELEIK